MGTESTFNTESIIAAANTLDAKGSPAVSTATDASTNVLLKQDPEKWGVESGPSEFSSKYSLYLSNLEREMATMRDQLDSFIASVRASAVAVENNESSVAEAVEQIAKHLEDQPDEPTRPYGHSAGPEKGGPQTAGAVSPKKASTPSLSTPRPSDYSSTGMHDSIRK